MRSRMKPTPDCDILPASTFPQAWLAPLPRPMAWPLSEPSSAVPSSPSITAITRVLAFSGSVIRIP